MIGKIADGPDPDPEAAAEMLATPPGLPANIADSTPGLLGRSAMTDDGLPEAELDTPMFDLACTFHELPGLASRGGGARPNVRERELGARMLTR